MTQAASDILASSGPVAKAMGDAFELRPQQLEMSRAIADTMQRRGKLLVEAGTGVGKSFAYLVPAIRRIVDSMGERKEPERVVVATNTIALQEQLIAKDVPLLLDLFKDDKGEPMVRAELVKGRGNYVSIRRLKMASERQDRLFGDEASRRSLHAIEDWTYKTTDGTLSSLPVLERPGVWDRVQSDSGNCMGRKCPTFEQCFYQNARRRMERAELLICNHALFFSDLALRMHGVGLLPDYNHVVLDEAHGVEDVASEHFGVSLTEGRVRHLLSMLVAAGGKKGFLPQLAVASGETELLNRAILGVGRAEDSALSFFDQVVEINSNREAMTRLPQPGVLRNDISPAFAELALVLKRLRDAGVSDADSFELNAYAERASAIAEEAAILVDQTMPGCVYWAETSVGEGGRGARVRSTLTCAPVEVGPLLREHLFSRSWSVTMTSATLTTGKSSFEHVKHQLGLDELPEADVQTLQLGSPFDHAAQVELHVDPTMPDPRAPEYVEELADRVLKHIEATDGGAFVLFTSFKTMEDIARLLRPTMERDARPMFIQGRSVGGGGRGRLIEEFKRDERSVLLGTSSFWQGVDVRGRGLRNVIITRLPFDPPDRPLTQARLERIQQLGGNPFMEDSLPRSVIRFKQGFGRLIRSATDSGRVVVLDPRIVTARYGRLFLDAIPEGVRVRRTGGDWPDAQ